MSEKTEPETKCRCNTIIGAETIRVRPGANGHVVIQQQNIIHDDDDTVFVLPHQIPRLVKLLQRVALEAEEIGEGCPVHDEDPDEPEPEARGR